MKIFMFNIIIFIFINSCSNKASFEDIIKNTFQRNSITIAPPPSLKVYPYSLGESAKFKQAHDQLPIDIVFSIDNSGSMDSYIQAVAGNIEKLIAKLDQANFNYQVGILKSTEDGNNQYGSKPVGNPSIVTSNDQNHVQKLVNNINHTLKMHDGYHERPLSIFEDAIDDSTNHGNNALFRNDSAKVLISLSDYSEYENYYYDESKVTSWYEYFERSFQNLPWVYIAIGSPPKKRCSGAESTDHWLTEALALKSGGSMGRICDSDYSSIMAKAVKTIFSLVRSFSLENYIPSGKKVLSESIEVYVDGESLPYSSQNGFAWNEFTKAVSFPGSYFPSKGENIEIYFEYIIP